MRPILLFFKTMLYVTLCALCFSCTDPGEETPAGKNPGTGPSNGPKQSTPTRNPVNGYIQISTFNDLCKIGNDNGYSLSDNYELVADIDVSASKNMNSGYGFKPIGSSYSYSFTGIFDGMGYTISNLYINRPNENYIGLFGCLGSRSEVKYLGIHNAMIIGNNYVGTLAGHNYGFISNCAASDSGSVTGNDYIGGFVGANNGTIQWSGSSSTVHGKSYVGGFAGTGGTINYSYSTGGVTGHSYVGGFVGSDITSIQQCLSVGVDVNGVSHYIGGFAGSIDGQVTNCYSIRKVSVQSGSQRVGGFAGEILWGRSVSYCYSVGPVRGSLENSVGGFVGNDGGNITGCFWNSDISDIGTDRSSAIGITNLEMGQQSTFTNAGWNFNLVWQMGELSPQLKVFFPEE